MTPERFLTSLTRHEILASVLLAAQRALSYGLEFPFNMQPWAREILSAEPELLM